MNLTYSNAYRIHATNNEAIIDFCFLMPDPDAGADHPHAMLLTTLDRVIMNFTNAKKLQISLDKLIKMYEDRKGEIPLDKPAGEN